MISLITQKKTEMVVRGGACLLGLLACGFERLRKRRRRFPHRFGRKEYYWHISSSLRYVVIWTADLERGYRNAGCKPFREADPERRESNLSGTNSAKRGYRRVPLMMVLLERLMGRPWESYAVPILPSRSLLSRFSESMSSPPLPGRPL